MATNDRTETYSGYSIDGKPLGNDAFILTAYYLAACGLAISGVATCVALIWRFV